MGCGRSPKLDVTVRIGDFNHRHIEAVEAVQKAIPRDYSARLTSQRLPPSPRLEGLRPGEVREVFP